MPPPRCKYCASCGQPLLPETGLGLSPTQWRIYDALRERPGLTFEQLWWEIWGRRKDGGPETRAALHSHIIRMNRRLCAHGLHIHATRTGHPGYAKPQWHIHHIPLTMEAAE